MKKTILSRLLAYVIVIGMIPLNLINVTVAYATPVPSTPTAEGICIDTDDNNAIYTTQINGTTGITNLYKNGEYVSTFANLEHANDLAYYNNHIYVASYSSNKIYRLKRYNDVYQYDKAYTLDDNSSVWNIATYKKDSSNRQLFVIGTSGNNQANLTFKIAYFRDTDNKFITVANFTAQNPNSSTTSETEPNILQGIVFKPDTEYLQICLSNKNQQGNKIVAVKLTMTSGSKAYTTSEETIRTFNDFDPSVKPKFEIEGMAVDSNYRYYVLVNEVGGYDPVYYVGFSGNSWLINNTVFNTITEGEATGPATPTAEGICIDTDDNNAIYTTQIDGTTGITNLYKNGEYVSAFANLEHANDLAYYNNHIYVASYDSNKIYRLKRYVDINGNNVYQYDKAYTLDDDSKAWNIATYKKDSNNRQLFVIGTSGNNKANLIFKIAYFRDTDNKFITVGSITVPNPNSSTTSETEPNILQGIAFKPDTEYLQICLSNENQQGNKIVAVKLTMTSGSKAYTISEETIRTFNDFNPSEKSKFEIQSMAVDSNYRYYVLVNETGGSDPVYQVGISNSSWVINSTVFNTTP